VVSDRDLFKALSPNIGTNIETYKDTATLNKRVHQIMSRKPKILREDATVDAAIDLFNACHLLHPHPERDDRLVGILSWRDILRSHHPRATPDEVS
jgi:acetoin utilization protein AcuB